MNYQALWITLPSKAKNLAAKYESGTTQSDLDILINLILIQTHRDNPEYLYSIAENHLDLDDTPSKLVDGLIEPAEAFAALAHTRKALHAFFETALEEWFLTDVLFNYNKELFI